MMNVRSANYLSESWHEEIPVTRQDYLQDQMRKFLGRGFNLVVLGSGGECGGRYCHVQIHHDKSGTELELHGVFEEPFVQDVFIAAQRIKLQARMTALKSCAADLAPSTTSAVRPGLGHLGILLGRHRGYIRRTDHLIVGADGS